MAQQPTLEWLSGSRIGSGAPLSDQVYGCLRSAIVFGDIAQGMPVQEPMVAAHFGVSRTPVREALLRLRSDGLITIKKQSGTFVAPIDPARVEEGMLVREALEPRVVERAAERLSARELSELETETRLMALAADDNDGRGFIAADDRFHQVLIEAGGFPHIAEIIDRVNAQLDRVRHLSTNNVTRARTAVKEHRALIKALRAGDSESSAEILAEHLRGSWIVIRAIVSERLGAANGSEQRTA